MTGVATFKVEDFNEMVRDCVISGDFVALGVFLATETDFVSTDLLGLVDTPLLLANAGLPLLSIVTVIWDMKRGSSTGGEVRFEATESRVFLTDFVAAADFGVRLETAGALFNVDFGLPFKLFAFGVFVAVIGSSTIDVSLDLRESSSRNTDLLATSFSAVDGGEMLFLTAANGITDFVGIALIQFGLEGSSATLPAGCVISDTFGEPLVFLGGDLVMR